MSADINNQGGFSGSQFSLQSEVGKDASKQDEKRQNPKEIAQFAFKDELSKAISSFTTKDLKEELQVLAHLAPQQVRAEPAILPVEARKSVNDIAQKIVTELQGAEQKAIPSLGKASEIQVPLPANMLGLADVRLVMAQGDLSVVLKMTAAGDAAVVAAAIQELAATLAQRFPNRAIRILKDNDRVEDGNMAAEFDPLNQPVRRKT